MTLLERLPHGIRADVLHRARRLGVWEIPRDARQEKIECLKKRHYVLQSRKHRHRPDRPRLRQCPYVIDGETPYLAQASAFATILLVQMNMTLNTLGLYQAGEGNDAARLISVIFHMPVIYTLLAVFTHPNSPAST